MLVLCAPAALWMTFCTFFVLFGKLSLHQKKMFCVLFCSMKLKVFLISYNRVILVEWDIFWKSFSPLPLGISFMNNSYSLLVLVLAVALLDRHRVHKNVPRLTQVSYRNFFKCSREEKKKFSLVPKYLLSLASSKKKSSSPLNPRTGALLSVWEKEAMFFSCQLALDTGRRGGDLTGPGCVACIPQPQNYSLLPAKALDRLCEMMLATAAV